MPEQILNLASWAAAWPGTPLLLAWALAIGLVVLGSRAWAGAAGVALLCMALLDGGPAAARFAGTGLAAFAAGWGGARLLERHTPDRPIARCASAAVVGALLLGWSFWAGGMGLHETPGGSGLLAAIVRLLAWALLWPGTGLLCACGLAGVLALGAGRTTGWGRASSAASAGLLLILALLLVSGEGRVRILEASAAAALLLGLALAAVLAHRTREAPIAVAILGLSLIGWTAAVRDCRGRGEYVHPAGIPISEPFARMEVLGRGVLLASSVAPAPDGRIFFGEFTTGRIGVFERSPSGWRQSTFGNVELARPTGNRRSYESGLWGIAVHPTEPWVYAMAPDSFEVGGEEIRGTSRIVRFRDVGGRAGPPEIVLGGLPAGPIHNGGALVFGPDGKLWASVGDGGVTNPKAGGPGTLPGTLVRLEPDGRVPSDNPFPGSPVVAWGFRNIYGFDFEPGTPAIWASENGPWCCDRITRVAIGRDHGWPRYGAGLGDAVAMASDPSVVAPVFDSGRSRISPTGLVWLPDGAYGQPSGTILFATWHTAAIHRLRVDGQGRVLAHDIVFDMLPARAPKGSLYAFAGGFSGLALGPDDRVYFSSLDAIGRIASLPPPVR